MGEELGGAVVGIIKGLVTFGNCNDYGLLKCRCSVGEEVVRSVFNLCEAEECIPSCGPCGHLMSSDPEGDRHRGQGHEGCFIGMFLDSVCLLNSGLWYCLMS